MFLCLLGESKKENVRLKKDTSQEEFVEGRKARDSKLDAPRLLLPSIQLNMNAGNLPVPDSNGKMYLKLPFNFLRLIVDYSFLGSLRPNNFFTKCLINFHKSMMIGF